MIQYQHRRVARRLTALGLAAVAVLAACGGDDDDSSAPATSDTESPQTPVTSQTSPTDTASPAEPDAPVVGGTFDFAVLSDAGCIDPQQVASLDNGYAARQAVDSLTDQDPETGELVPWLAESWEADDTASEFTFVLRDGVTFGDGSALTAEVVKANLDQIIELGARAGLASSYLAGYVESEVIDERTVVVKFGGPNAQFLQATSTFNLGIESLASVSMTPDEKCSGIDGSGPFVQGDYVPNASLTLTRRDDYAWPSALWENQGTPYLETLVFNVVSESSVRMGGLQSGELDAIAGVTAVDAGVLAGTDGVSVLLRTNPGMPMGLTANSSAGLAADPVIRRAISMAINRDEIVEVNYPAGTKPATSVLSSTTPGYVDLGAELGYDLDGATALLEENGWTVGDDGIRAKDGQRLEVVATWTGGAVGNQTLLELAQQQLTAAGIQLSLVERDQATFVSDMQASAFEFLLTSSTRADADILRTNFATTLANIYQVPVTPLDDLLADQAAEPDPAVRADMIRQIQETMVAELYQIPLVELVTVLGVDDAVHGVAMDATSRLRLQDAWKDA